MGFHELTVPDSMWPDLVMLNIDRNYVSQLPAKIQECTALEELRCSSNQVLLCTFNSARLRMLHPISE